MIATLGFDLVGQVKADAARTNSVVGVVDEIEAFVVDVRPVAAEHLVGADRECPGRIARAQNVVTIVSEKLVLVGSADDDVVAVVAVEDVAAGAAVDIVVAIAAMRERVGVLLAIDLVVARARRQFVDAHAAVDFVIA